jgi:hypothetical protein
VSKSIPGQLHRQQEHQHHVIPWQASINDTGTCVLGLAHAWVGACVHTALQQSWKVSQTPWR